MPTLLELAGIEPPASCEGVSMVGKERRATLYGDIGEAATACRMLHDGRHKLIWYPAGNTIQLFDLAEDPTELRDLAEAPAYAGVRAGLEAALARELWGSDLDQGWVVDGRLVGYDPGPFGRRPDRSLSGQRGVHYPQPAEIAKDQMVGFAQ